MNWGMLLLVFIIISTIVAWIRGWKSKALFPVVIWFGIEVILMIVSHTPGSRQFTDTAGLIDSLVDMGLLIALVVMMLKPPEGP